MKNAKKFRIGRVIKVIVMLLLIALGGVLLWVRALIMSSLPKVDGTLSVSGLSAPVDVIRDEFGVPHIFARNEDDLFLAAGYVQAQDRLFEMDLLRRAAEGKLAEIFGDRPLKEGEGGPTILSQDKAQRVFGFLDSAKRDASGLDPRLKHIIERYCQGVNAFIEQNKPRLPLEFRLLGYTPQPWTVVDVLAQSRFLSFQLSGNYNSELVRSLLDAKVGPILSDEIFPRHKDPGPYIIPDDGNANTEFMPLAARLEAPEAFKQVELASRLLDLDSASRYQSPVSTGFGASNSWVISGKLSASGAPILSNDPHLSHMLPSLFYEMHLAGGGIDVIGVAFPGLPFIVLGHNRYVAWSATTTAADTQDLYIEKTDSNDPDRYLHNDEWKRFDRRIEVIYVKGSDPVELTVDSSVHGPVLNSIFPEMGKDSPPMALAWPGIHGARDGIFYYLAMKAKSVDECFRAADLNEVPVQNWMFADVNGHIGYYPAGLYPLRRPGHTGLRPVPGSGEFDWLGFADPKDIPRLIDPEQGYILSANNQVMAYPREPFVITNENSAYYRARRIQDLLTASNEWKDCFMNLNRLPRAWDKCAGNYDVFSRPWLWPWKIDSRKGMNVDYMLAMQKDNYSLQARRLVPVFLAAIDKKNAFRKYLEQWDLRTDADSIGATIFYKTYQRAWHDVLGDELGDDLLKKFMSLNISSAPFDNLLDSEQSALFDDVKTPEVEDRNKILSRSFDAAVEELKKIMGPDPGSWHWGRIHTLNLVHALGRVKILGWFFNIRPVPSAGADDVIYVAGFDLKGRTFPVLFGPVLRHVVDMSDPARKGGMVIDTGESGHFKSPHYWDQVVKRLNCELIPALMDRDEIEKNKEGALRLEPKK